MFKPFKSRTNEMMRVGPMQKPTNFEYILDSPCIHQLQMWDSVLDTLLPILKQPGVLIADAIEIIHIRRSISSESSGNPSILLDIGLNHSELLLAL